MDYYEYIRSEVGKARIERDRAVAQLIFAAADRLAGYVVGVIARATSIN